MANVLLIIYTHLIFSTLFHLSYTNGFAEEPQDTVVSVGQTVTLSCVISSRSSADSPHVYWFKSHSPTTTGSAIAYRRQAFNAADRTKYLISGTGYHYNLQIVNTELTDRGYYYCSVIAGNGYVHSRRARLDIYEPGIVPTCSFEPSDRSLDVGDMVTIECRPSPATTSRQSLAMWKGRNGVRVPIIRTRGDESLTHEFQLREEDRNRPYTCTPSETYLNVNNCTVIPLPHHTINLTPRRATAELGGTVGFSRETRGNPPFNQFIWVVSFDRKKVQRLTESSGRFIVSTNGVSGRLNITDVINSDNNTAVVCEATNFHGDILISHQACMFIRSGSSTETSSNCDNTVDTQKVPSWSTLAVEANTDVMTLALVSGTVNYRGDEGSSVVATGVPVTAIIVSTITVVTLIVPLSLLCWWRIRSKHRHESCLKPTQRESSQQNASSAVGNDPGSTSIYSSPTYYSSHIYNDSDPHQLSTHQNKTSDDIQLTSGGGRTYCRRILQDDKQIDNIPSVAPRDEHFYNEPDEGNSSYEVVAGQNVAQDNYIEITE